MRARRTVPVEDARTCAWLVDDAGSYCSGSRPTIAKTASSASRAAAGSLREALQALGIEAPLLRIALADAAAILLCRGRGDFEVDAPSLMCPGVQHLIAPASLDYGNQSIAQ